MTSDQFKEARRSLGLSIGDLASIININKRTILKWERGDYPPNPVACRVMEWMLDGFIPPEFEDLFED